MVGVIRGFALSMLAAPFASATASPKSLAGRIANNEAAVPLGETPSCLDPADRLNTGGRFWLTHAYEGLLTYNEKGHLALGAVERMSTAPDGMRVVFTLRQGAKWHDGKPLTAKDFEFAWQRVVAPDTVSEAAFLALNAHILNARAIVNGKAPPTTLGARALDARTFEVRFEAPSPQFKAMAAHPAFVPVRRDLVEKFTDKFGCTKDSIVGNGPFRVARWEIDGSVRAERVVEAKGAKLLSAIESVGGLPGAPAQYSAFSSGFVDVANLDRDRVRQAQQDARSIQSSDDGAVFWLELNQREGSLFAAPRLRKALQLLIDRDDFVKFLVGIPGTRATSGVVPDFLPGSRAGTSYRAESPLALPSSNPDEARKLVAAHLKATNLPRVPPISLLIDDVPIQRAFGEYLREKLLRAFDTEIRVEPLSFEARRQRTSAGRFDIAFSGWQADILDAGNFLEPFLSESDQNHGKFANAKFDLNVKAAATERSPQKRVRLMAEAERILVAEQAGVLPLYQRARAWLASPGLEGVVRSPVGPDPDLRFARWLRK